MISLTIPPDATAFAVLRTTASAIAARADLTLDQLDDVRMAVEEAAVMLLGLGHPITLSADVSARPFVLTISVPVQITITRDDDSLSWMVLGGVTDDVQVHAHPGATSLQLTFANVASNA